MKRLSQIITCFRDRNSILLMVFVMLVARVAAHSATAIVTLRPDSEVRAAQSVKLADVAGIDAPKELAVKIGNIAVGSGPLPGQRRSVGSDYIRMKLKAARIDRDVKLIGPEKIDIIGQCTRFSKDELAEQARAFVVEQLPTSGASYDVGVTRAPKDIVTAQGADVQVRPRLMNSTIKPGPMTVVLDVIVDGKTAATTSVALNIKAVAEIMIATGAIRQGEALTPSNTTWELKDITNVRDSIRRGEGDDAQDWIARRSIQSGSVITSQSVEMPPAVKRGDTVSLIVKCGKVTLHTTAEVKQDGRTGDTIRVLAAVSNGEIRAKVVEPGLVEIIR